jgi:hypothetical protein
VGERTSERDYGLLGYAAAHSRNLREALDRDHAGPVQGRRAGGAGLIGHTTERS